MGEPRSNRPRTCRLEYRFDRLLPDKLAQVYQLLVPDKRRPVGRMGESPAESPPSSTEITDEQTSCRCDLKSALAHLRCNLEDSGPSFQVWIINRHTRSCSRASKV